MSDALTVVLATNPRVERAQLDAVIRPAVHTLHTFVDRVPPDAIEDIRPDLLVSYRHHYVLPASALAASRRTMNCHPGPPEYPGIGSTNWALYEGAVTFGVTLHEMAPVPDTGTIFAVRRFPLVAEETLASLTTRTHAVLFGLFAEVWPLLLRGPLTPCGVQWSGPPRTRQQLDALATVTASMSPHELTRRIRATDAPGYPLRWKIGDGVYAVSAWSRPSRATTDEQGGIAWP